MTPEERYAISQALFVLACFYYDRPLSVKGIVRYRAREKGEYLGRELTYFEFLAWLGECQQTI